MDTVAAFAFPIAAALLGAAAFLLHRRREARWSRDAIDTAPQSTQQTADPSVEAALLSLSERIDQMAIRVVQNQKVVSRSIGRESATGRFVTNRATAHRSRKIEAAE